MPLPGDTTTYISTQTTTQVYTGRCILKNIIITETAAGTITVYDEIGSDTTHIIAVFKASIAEGSYPLNAVCARGVKVVTAAASKLTVGVTT